MSGVIEKQVDRHISATVFLVDDDDILIHPEKHFPKGRLEKLEPYHIFTGEGIAASVVCMVERECPHCGQDMEEQDEETRCFVSQKDLDKFLEDDDNELISTKPCFYARAVKQNLNVTFFDRGAQRGTR